jgi:type II secretory ATPase GspE/PulE/Tfp pilus assembly ATPase PilB-like protein
METSEAIQDLVLRSASASEVRKYCTDRGMVTMLQDGMEKARQGVTTPAEVIRHAFSLSSPTTPAAETEGSLTR